MAIMRRITEINGEIIMVETMIIVGNIILCTIHINGELVKYEILSVGQLGILTDSMCISQEWESQLGTIMCQHLGLF